MKKNKFLSIAVMAAFMALGLSSCEKEDFRYENINVEINAAPAEVVFKPNVIVVVNGTVKNVTDEVTPAYSNEPTAGEDGTIAAQDVTITVSYTVSDDEFGISTTLSESQTVSIPEVKRGQIYTATPTIILNAQTETSYSQVPGTEEAYDALPTKTISIKNFRDFYYTDVEAKYPYKTGSEVLEESINWLDPKYQDDLEIMAIINAFNNAEEKEEPLPNVTVYAQSQTIITITYEAVKTKYTISKKGKLGEDSQEIQVVEFEVISYTNHTPSYQLDIHLGGVDHGHGHGHGHGHDSSANAGGGIVIGD